MTQGPVDKQAGYEKNADATPSSHPKVVHFEVEFTPVETSLFMAQLLFILVSRV